MLGLSREAFTWVMAGWLALGVAAMFGLRGFVAPFGRHFTASAGPSVDNRLGWMAMEAVALAAFAAFFLAGPMVKTAPAWIIFGLWTGHYLNRSFVYPLRTRTRGKRIPVMIVASSAVFNLINGWANGAWLGFAEAYPADWLFDPRFVTGLLVFLAGAAINIDADRRLMALRAPGETGYRIPRGGLFGRISCANHFGEVVEWTGFAILCWNLPALAFAVWTAANLVPRALAHHRWYRATFADYPPERRAILPGVL